MTENSKTPPAKKTIQDPPEYSAATDHGENVQLEDPAEIPMGGAEALASDNTEKSGDWLGGPQNGAEAPASNDDRGRVPAADVKKAPKGSLSGGVDEQEGGGPDVSARNPQTGEGYARNPQTGE
ncbi:hypothetical protein CN217_12635 [Sinorhizobium meliloti]|uniref:hypothetical protein n=1 Tax=Rhizobium meliloti TaxID=382 RepID=UPI000FD356B7|nr:hypothetical protein [Sinorhizobium meliloti]RVH12085.1 hypothetical protein CN217_12635 [Sinorhizobium meliloti]